MANKMCGIDPDLQVMIHRFDYGSAICRCGERAIRRPVMPQRAGAFGRMATGEMKFSRKRSDVSQDGLTQTATEKK